MYIAFKLIVVVVVASAAATTIIINHLCFTTAYNFPKPKSKIMDLQLCRLVAAFFPLFPLCDEGSHPQENGLTLVIEMVSHFTFLLVPKRFLLVDVTKQWNMYCTVRYGMGHLLTVTVNSNTGWYDFRISRIRKLGNKTDPKQTQNRPRGAGLWRNVYFCATQTETTFRPWAKMYNPVPG